MKHDNLITRCLVMPLMTATVALTLLLSSTLSPAWAGKPGGGGSPPVDSGTVYFHYYDGAYGQVWSMKPDGSGKTALSVSTVWGVAAEPSRGLHAGKRWFLTVQDIPGEAYPPRPDGVEDPRQELFAVSDLGEWVQLTDDPSVQPATSYVGGPAPRWTMDAGTIDGRVTFLGRRWGVDEYGDPVIIETGLYYVNLDPEALGIGLVPQAPILLANLDLPEAFSSDYGRYAQVYGYDWSPDASQIVYATGEELRVAQAGDGQTTTFLATTSGNVIYPRWSPIQPTGRTQILFGINAWGRIDRINDDGTGWVTVIPAGTGQKERIDTTSTCWSPAGTHFLYRLVLQGTKPGAFPTTHTCRATADGKDKVNLTPNMSPCVPLGWMNP